MQNQSPKLNEELKKSVDEDLKKFAVVNFVFNIATLVIVLIPMCIFEGLEYYFLFSWVILFFITLHLLSTKPYLIDKVWNILHPKTKR